MEVFDEDEEVRQALEDAQLKQALALSKQPTPTPPTTPNRHTASASGLSGTSKKSQHQNSHTPAHPIHSPPQPRTNKTTKASKTAPPTPVKAKPLLKPTIHQALHSYKQNKAAITPVTPVPKRRRGKTSPAAAVHDQYQTEQADITADDQEVFPTEEEIPNIDSEQSAEPPEAPKKKKRRN